MKLNITREDKSLKIIHEDKQKFIFDIDGTVDLNEFIKYTSESEEIIDCEPESFDAFKTGDPDIKEEALKLVEYIFKIIDAFNASYTEVYEGL